MNPKTETPTESQTSTDTKPAVTKPAKAQSTPSTPEPVLKATESLETGQAPGTPPESSGKLAPEVIELVTELRDTVKRLQPHKHTTKSLRRALSSVSAILADIEALYEQL
ncbi:hypothetical protein [Methylosarcina fibrata]|uniref:hypothetical protein n=1 Tax=Methylosarcina fibrata TaxID=105972 RepID=UPI000363DEF4|nr:hypothetical protein [Methylosarcina fibrata]